MIEVENRMQIHKFGGASVKDAQGVRNIVKILRQIGCQDKVIVISAMGKTTNALEKVVEHYFNQRTLLKQSIQSVKDFHKTIACELFESEHHPVFQMLTALFEQLNDFLQGNTSSDYDFVYDQVVVFGELLSTTIVSCFLREENIDNQWIDARELIKTDSHYRDGSLLWKETSSRIKSYIKSNQLFVTQGFIASDMQGFSTTLGREGSDYSAAIFSYCLQAQGVTIWKDVAGVLSADPRYFSNAELLLEIPYREAIELAFYGASIIHPKTLQPLQQKEIPLFVRSFLDVEQMGSIVCNAIDLKPKVPCFIVKKKQILLSLSSLDFSFIMEEHISYIFSQLHIAKLKVSLIQNTAISFSVCLEDKYNSFFSIIPLLEKKFNVSYTVDVDLFTIRHATEKSISELNFGEKILLKQQLHETVQIVVK